MPGAQGGCQGHFCFFKAAMRTNRIGGMDLGMLFTRIWGRSSLRTLLALLLLLGAWETLSSLAGKTLVPGPLVVLVETAGLLADLQSWRSLAVTAARGFAGLVLATGFALLLGVPCGLCRPLLDLVRPPIHLLQGCPTILWITLLLVWTGSGSVVPIAVKIGRASCRERV